MNINRDNLPFEYRLTELVIREEIGREIHAGNVSYEWCVSVVDEIVNIVDEAVLRIGYGHKM